MSTLAEDNTKVANEVDHSGRPTYDDVNVPFVVVLGIVSAIITYVCIVGVQGLFYHWQDAQIREKEYGKTIAAAATIDEQKNLLSDFHEAKTGDAKSIPIDLAMTLTLNDFANADQHKKHDDGHGDDHAAGDDHGKKKDESDAGEKKADHSGKKIEAKPVEKSEESDSDDKKKADDADKKEDTKKAEPKADDAKKDDARKEEPKAGEAKAGEAKADEAKSEDKKKSDADNSETDNKKTEN